MQYYLKSYLNGIPLRSAFAWLAHNAEGSITEKGDIKFKHEGLSIMYDREFKKFLVW